MLTDGAVYGTTIFLGDGVDASAFHEITEEEYKQIVAVSIPDDLSEEQATEEDYKAALSEFGVKI